MIQKYNLRMTSERIQDFRSTIKEIIDVERGIPPRDIKELDNEEYGKLS
jgi:hypothetical protein